MLSGRAADSQLVPRMPSRFSAELEQKNNKHPEQNYENFAFHRRRLSPGFFDR
jgi:hypothetical protein